MTNTMLDKAVFPSDGVNVKTERVIEIALLHIGNRWRFQVGTFEREVETHDYFDLTFEIDGGVTTLKEAIELAISVSEITGINLFRWELTHEEVGQ